MQPVSETMGEVSVGTIVVADLVGYSTLARLLEQNTGTAAVAELNRRIQLMIRSALASDQLSRYTIIAETGDGAIVLFESAECAHRFSEQLHRLSDLHNSAKTEKTAHRQFRIGICTGEISPVNGEDGRKNFAGITIANAVRLETSAKPRGNCNRSSDL